MADKPDFSLILACYNEAEHIQNSVPKIVDALSISNYSYEIIFIDDKSSDSTPKLIKEITKGHKNFRAYFHKKNLGRGGTVSEGIRLAKSEIVGFIDIDLEVSPMYIPHFITSLKKDEADIIIAHRHYPSYFFPPSSFIRMVFSKGYLKLGRLFLGLKVEDTEAGYKFFKRSKILPILKHIKNNHWFWDTEVVIRSMMSGLRVKYIPTLFLKRSDKTSTVKLIPDTIEYLQNIGNFRRLLAAEKKSPPGLLYRSTAAYRFAIQRLFGQDYEQRYKKLSSHIDTNSTVVDVCCGDAKLFDFIQDKNIDYLGMDISLAFVRNLLNKNSKAIFADITKDKIPTADIIIMQGSLYQFDNPSVLVEKLYKVANKKLIISESIINLGNQKWMSIPYLDRLSSYLVSTNTNNPHFRFNEKTFKNLLKKYKPRYEKTKNGRDIIAVIMKQSD